MTVSHGNDSFDGDFQHLFYGQYLIKNDLYKFPFQYFVIVLLKILLIVIEILISVFYAVTTEIFNY